MRCTLPFIVFCFFFDFVDRNSFSGLGRIGRGSGPGDDMQYDYGTRLITV